MPLALTGYNDVIFNNVETATPKTPRILFKTFCGVSAKVSKCPKFTTIYILQPLKITVVQARESLISRILLMKACRELLLAP